MKSFPVHWRHNEPDGVSNHQPRDWLLKLFIQVQIKENIKAPRHWPMRGEFTGDKKPVTRKMFPFDDVIMHSSADELPEQNGLIIHH